MDKNLTIEQANEQLDSIISQLENEALPLSESVALYSKACELMAYCMQALDGYKGKIEEANEKLAQFTTEAPHE